MECGNMKHNLFSLYNFLFMVVPMLIGLVTFFSIERLRQKHYKKLPERGAGAEYEFIGADPQIELRYKRLIRLNQIAVFIMLLYTILVFLPFGGLQYIV